jgi:hypothetical protein
MFQTRVNLLSKEKQRFLDKMIILQFIKNIFDTTLFSLCLIGIVLLTGESILQKHFNTLAKQSIYTTTQYSGTNEEFEKINTLIKKGNLLQSDYTSLSEIINNFSSIITEGIEITTITINTKEQKISFSGTANTRSNLLNLEKSINTSKMFHPIKIPLTDLTKKESIPFTLSPEIK